MTWFHIHIFKVVGIEFEQPCTASGQPAYMDYNLKKCRCGKRKAELITAYYADRVPVDVNDKFSMLSLVNKRTIIE